MLSININEIHDCLVTLIAYAPKLSDQNGLVLKPETLTLTNPKPASALNSIDRTFAVAAAMAVALA